ncbi:hypothetical protein [Lactobacillus delbrueckii]|uniref:hypothetical protein n=1 Tax=Lactobacillus delbrueckii TaxID=1584 RepID=UPI001F249C93|nr:hypothetical protein [Lactobacillus delbrueckii]
MTKKHQVFRQLDSVTDKAAESSITLLITQVKTSRVKEKWMLRHSLRPLLACKETA